jgi:hypothetical protein
MSTGSRRGDRVGEDVSMVAKDLSLLSLIPSNTDGKYLRGARAKVGHAEGGRLWYYLARWDGRH